MAMSVEQFIEKTKCEVVCDQMIVGFGPKRKMIGYVKEGTFTITDEGHEYLAELDAPAVEETEDKPKRGRPRKEVTDESVTE
ncbi:MAG: hypothetical protein ACO24H_03320 [Polynucleobacter sp.]